MYKYMVKSSYSDAVSRSMSMFIFPFFSGRFRSACYKEGAWREDCRREMRNVSKHVAGKSRPYTAPLGVSPFNHI